MGIRFWRNRYQPHNAQRDGEYLPPNAWIQTTLSPSDNQGAVHHRNKKYLWVRVQKARTFVAGFIRYVGEDQGMLRKGSIVQAAQSSKSDEDNDITTIRFEMNGMANGKYELSVVADAGPGYSQGIKDMGFTIW